MDIGNIAYNEVLNCILITVTRFISMTLKKLNLNVTKRVLDPGE